MKKLRVAVLAGGISSEHDVSLRSAATALKALDRKKYQPRLVKISRKGDWSARLTRANTDVALIMLHGRAGEGGGVQGYLETLGIPYTGSGIMASSLAMDKQRTLELFGAHGLTTTVTVGIRKGEEVTPAQLRQIGLPCVVKPNDAGSSVGVFIVKSKKELQPAIAKTLRYSTVALVQKMVRGTELTCGVLQVGNKMLALPPTQIVPRGHDFFDFDAKYQVGGSEEITPAPQPAAVITAIQETALRCHELLRCRGVTRTDMILTKDGQLSILETNTIPGMTQTSLVPQAALAARITLPKLLDDLIRDGLAAYRERISVQ